MLLMPVFITHYLSHRDFMSYFIFCNCLNCSGFLLALVLLLHGGLGHLALQNLFPLFVHVALHPSEGVVPHLTQV